MPLHDWARMVEVGMFPDFHHGWIDTLRRMLNDHYLPPDYYAAAEVVAGSFVPDVLTLNLTSDWSGEEGGDGGAGVAVRPRPAATAEIDSSRLPTRRGASVVVRHSSGDRPVAVVEVVSPSNKEHARDLGLFVRKAEDLLRHDIHLLVLDLLPPGRHDPDGPHAAIWGQTFRRRYRLPAPGLRTFASYESGTRIRAYVHHCHVGQDLPEVPLFLAPDQCVPVPLEDTYRVAYAGFPARWRAVLEAAPALPGGPG
jgi:hypothetical protein